MCMRGLRFPLKQNNHVHEAGKVKNSTFFLTMGEGGGGVIYNPNLEYFSSSSNIEKLFK